MRHRRFGWFWLLAVGVLVAPPPARGEAATVVEFRLPAFDDGGVVASYALARPAEIDPEQTLPLILDLHGAIHPSKRGGTLTVERAWVPFVQRVHAIVAAPNCRTRGWNRIQGPRDDRAYVSAVLADVRERFPIDPTRIYLAGFSSGADFACTGGLQLDGAYAGTLVICSGPPNVVGIRDGSLEAAKDHPFVFVTGEEDYIRKSGGFEAYLHLLTLEGKVTYREVPDVGHAFFGVDEYVALFHRLEALRTPVAARQRLEAAQAAFDAGDLRQAALLAQDVPRRERRKAKALRKEIEKRGTTALEEAATIDARMEPGRAYEAWWTIHTTFHTFPRIDQKARNEMDDLREREGNRDLLRARRAFFEAR